MLLILPSEAFTIWLAKQNIRLLRLSNGISRQGGHDGNNFQGENVSF